MASRRASRSVLAIAGLLFTAACSTDDTVAPEGRVQGAMTVDASTGWAYVSLEDSAVVTPANPSTSTEWDIAFYRQAVMLNGGQAGPGGVTGACLCNVRQLSLTNAELYAQDTSATQRAAAMQVFDTLTRVPSALAYDADSLAPVINGWATSAGAGATPVAGRAFLVRLANTPGTTTSTGTAKVRVTAIEQPTATSAGRVTLQYAIAPAGTTTWGSDQTITVDASAGAKLVDLDTGREVTTGLDWELKIDGWFIRTNGGVSGTGGVLAATVPAGSSYEAVAVGGVPAQGYAADVFTGIFGTYPWNLYNLAGNHRITPTYDIYVIRRGGVTYKMQVISFYDATGTSRRVTFRYASL